MRVFRRAAGTIGTDHHLMRSKIKLHLKSIRKKNQQTRLCLDRLKLQDNMKDDREVNEKYFIFV